jgi:hypothetical protein
LWFDIRARRQYHPGCNTFADRSEGEGRMTADQAQVPPEIAARAMGDAGPFEVRPWT